MALAHCILGKFLGVGCHCFPPPLGVPTFCARCLHVQRRERPLAAEGGTLRGREIFRLESDFHLILEIFYMPQICDMGQTALLPLRRKACWGFFTLKSPTASARFEPANLGTKCQHTTSIPPKPCWEAGGGGGASCYFHESNHDSQAIQSVA
jgi:hypothetical protein